MAEDRLRREPGREPRKRPSKNKPGKRPGGKKPGMNPGKKRGKKPGKKPGTRPPRRKPSKRLGKKLGTNNIVQHLGTTIRTDPCLSNGSSKFRQPKWSLGQNHSLDTIHNLHNLDLKGPFML